MKIGIYSDVHISRTSSIMPLYLNENSKYTLRLQNCINSMNEMYQTFENKKTRTKMCEFCQAKILVQCCFCF